jgi:prevent-host-death family protein
MRAIGIRELKEQASEVLRRVREEGDTYEITYHGRVVARLVPVAQPRETDSSTEFLESWGQLTESISRAWPEGVSAVEAVREGRREL